MTLAKVPCLSLCHRRCRSNALSRISWRSHHPALQSTSHCCRDGLQLTVCIRDFPSLREDPRTIDRFLVPTHGYVASRIILFQIRTQMNRSSTRDIWQPIAAGYMWEHLKQTEPRMSDSCSTGFMSSVLYLAHAAPLLHCRRICSCVGSLLSCGLTAGRSSLY